jgi:DNA-binding response OmpR family regulator
MKSYPEPVLGPMLSPGRPTGHEATVLVIDDDPSMHDILAVLGNQHGFGIQFADDGSDGLRLAEQNDVDLIVLDLNLPGLTGFDVCRRIRAAGIEIPIVMVSASSDPVDIVVGLEIGADD